jgi:hypothetical protein
VISKIISDRVQGYVMDREAAPARVGIWQKYSASYGTEPGFRIALTALNSLQYPGLRWFQAEAKGKIIHGDGFAFASEIRLIRQLPLSALKLFAVWCARRHAHVIKSRRPEAGIHMDDLFLLLERCAFHQEQRDKRIVSHASAIEGLCTPPFPNADITYTSAYKCLLHALDACSTIEEKCAEETYLVSRYGVRAAMSQAAHETSAYLDELHWQEANLCRALVEVS